jgi:uncharacterized membrane protein
MKSRVIIGVTAGAIIGMALGYLVSHGNAGASIRGVFIGGVMGVIVGVFFMSLFSRSADS